MGADKYTLNKLIFFILCVNLREIFSKNRLFCILIRDYLRYQLRKSARNFI